MLLFAICACFRILNALAIRTYFNPDEYWQSLEVAYRLVFGTQSCVIEPSVGGSLADVACYTTWEWHPSLAIRGYLHPLLFAVAYKFLHVLGLDSRWAVVCGVTAVLRHLSELHLVRI